MSRDATLGRSLPGRGFTRLTGAADATAPVTVNPQTEIDARPEVLLAEDDRELRRLLATALASAGFRVTQSESGTDLLAQLWKRPAGENGFDLIISDNRMPGFSGLEVLEGLREECEPRIANTPVILITAFGDQQVHQDAENLGAMVFDKPFDVDDFCSCAVKLVQPEPAQAPVAPPPVVARRHGCGN